LAQLELATARHPFATGRYWEVSKNGKTSWIIGTIHLDDSRVRKVPRFFSRKIKKARVVMVEVTPPILVLLKRYNDSHTERFIRKHGKPVQQSYTPAQWAKIVKIAKTKGVGKEVLARVNPMAIAGLLSKPVCATQPKQFLDASIMLAALKAQVPLLGLDDLSYRKKLIRSRAGNDRFFLGMTKIQLAQWNTLPSRMETLVQLYHHGETIKAHEYENILLNALTKDRKLIRANKKNYDNLIVKRNRIWMKKLQGQLATGNAVVAVGALHLPSKKGLLYLLQQRGFSVKRLQL